jgi:hypothetical protein
MRQSCIRFEYRPDPIWTCWWVLDVLLPEGWCQLRDAASLQRLWSTVTRG